MTSLTTSNISNNDDMIKRDLFAAGRIRLPFDDKNNWKTALSESSLISSDNSDLTIEKIEQSTPSKKKKKSSPFKKRKSNKKLQNNISEPLLASKLLELPKLSKTGSIPLFSSFFVHSDQNKDSISREQDESSLKSHSCSSLSLDTVNEQLQVMNVQTSPFDLNSVNALKTSNIFSNLFSGSQLPNQTKGKLADNKESFLSFVNDSANLFEDMAPNKDLKSSGFYRLSVLERTTESFLSNDASRLFLDELERLSESDGDETNINKFMQEEQQRYEYLNNEMSGTDLEIQNMNHFIKDVKKQQRREKIKRRTDRLKDIFRLKTSTFVLNKSNLFDLKDKDILESQQDRIKDNIELAHNLSGEFDITKSSGLSELSSHYPQTNLSPPSDFIAFHEILDPESNALEIENAKTNSMNEILEHDFLSNNEEAFVTQEKTFEEKIKNLKRAGSQKWALMLSSMNNGKKEINTLQPETGISVNTTVKNFEKQELNVLQSSFAAGVETDILRKIEHETDPAVHQQGKKIPPKYVPLYQKNSKISKKDLLTEGQAYYSPLKGSESTTSDQKLLNLGRRWWIFGSLGERKHDKVDKGLDLTMINDADSLVISNYINDDSDSTDDKVLDLSKNEGSLFRKLTRNFTKRGLTNAKKTTSQPRKKSLSVSFVKYTTNIYKNQNEGLEPVTLASEFKAKPILKKL